MSQPNGTTGRVYTHFGAIYCCLGLLRRVHQACSRQANTATDGATMRVYPSPNSCDMSHVSEEDVWKFCGECADCTMHQLTFSTFGNGDSESLFRNLDSGVIIHKLNLQLIPSSHESKQDDHATSWQDDLCRIT